MAYLGLSNLLPAETRLFYQEGVEEDTGVSQSVRVPSAPYGRSDPNSAQAQWACFPHGPRAQWAGSLGLGPPYGLGPNGTRLNETGPNGRGPMRQDYQDIDFSE